MTGPRHFLLDRRAGWRGEPLLAIGVETDDGVVRLRPLPGAPQPVADASGTFGGLSEPVGVAAGADGTIVVLDRDGNRVLRYDPCALAFAPLPCLDELAGATDIAISRRGDVVVADAAARRLVVLVGAGLAIRRVAGPWKVDGDTVRRIRPRRDGWPAKTWEPWGVAARADGLVVTDRANGLVHFLDGCGRHLAATDGAGPGVPGLVHPTAVAVDGDGRVYVLQQDSVRVRILDRSGFIADVDALDDRRHVFCPVAVAVAPNGDLCVAGAGGDVCVLSDGGGGWNAVGVTPVDGPVRGLAFDAGGDAVTVDGSRCCVVRMRNGGGYPKTGRFVSTALDSGLANCRWHRVALTGSVPAGTAVRVQTLTAEAPLTPAEILALPEARWATGQTASVTDGTGWDCLVTGQPGRYLWLALSFASDGAATPEIADVEVEFPRCTSLDHLPGAFRSDPDSADFLERFLAVFDAQRATVGRQVDRIAALFDPLAAPADERDVLSWLAGWVGLAFDEGIPIARRRRLLREAASLYRLRGTPEGVRRFVSLFCGVEVRLLEHYKLRRWAIAGRGRLGDTELYGSAIVRRLQLDEYSEIGSFQLIDTDDPLRDPFHVYAHRFSLLLIAREDDRLLARARRVAELAKPAHTVVDVAAVEPRMRVGTQSMIGFDTVIGEVPPPARAGQARLGDGVVVGPDPRLGPRPRAQVGLRARVGVDTGLE
ncbi:phage tail protein [Solirubrobacter soli]|uniref:phage tail protein n=1 Tax=Solirubrobacter soli TaxID=363832 RepID=UPI00040E6CD8|nr:phage tail protein [Solirubrobacter soli]